MTTKLRVNQSVFHRRYGTGQVISLSNRKFLLVAFDSYVGIVNRSDLILVKSKRQLQSLRKKLYFSNRDWQMVKAMYDYRCLGCGKREPEIKLERDHVIPKSKRGAKSIKNIQPLCRACNSHKRVKTIDYRRELHKMGSPKILASHSH